MEFDIQHATIERCDKDSEEILAKENEAFLNTSISYLAQHANEFIYIESPSFEKVKTDAFSFELDDVFQTYLVLFGFKVQKKYSSTIKSYLTEHLKGDNVYYSSMFSGEDGLWDLNIPINFMEGYHDDITLREAISLTLNFLEGLVNSIE